MVSKQEQENKLALIPKTERYIEYMLDIMIKLPRTEKFSIGTEYKKSMYKMLNEIMLLNKEKNINNLKKENSKNIEVSQYKNEKDSRYYKQIQRILKILNKIDTYLNTQRIYLRIMKKYKWIDEKNLK